MSTNNRSTKSRHNGFTLVEILLVIVIIAVMLAVIIPRAYRARSDTEFNIVRQTAAELGKWGMVWAERNLQTQPEDATCTLDSYVNTLAGAFIPDGGLNWAAVGNDMTSGCRTGTTALTTSVQDVAPDEKPINPFNGLSYYSAGNDASTAAGPQSGQLALVVGQETIDSVTYNAYYFIYIGRDATSASDWFGNQGTDLTNMRNGVFMARLRP